MACRAMYHVLQAKLGSPCPKAHPEAAKKRSHLQIQPLVHAGTALTGGERPQLVHTRLGDRSDAEEQKLAAASLSVCPDLAKAFVSTSLTCFPRAAFHRPSPFAQLRANHSLQHFTQLPSMMDAAWKHPAFLHCQIY